MTEKCPNCGKELRGLIMMVGNRYYARAMTVDAQIDAFLDAFEETYKEIDRLDFLIKDAWNDKLTPSQSDTVNEELDDLVYEIAFRAYLLIAADMSERSQGRSMGKVKRLEKAIEQLSEIRCDAVTEAHENFADTAEGVGGPW